MYLAEGHHAAVKRRSLNGSHILKPSPVRLPSALFLDFFENDQV